MDMPCLAYTFPAEVSQISLLSSMDMQLSLNGQPIDRPSLNAVGSTVLQGQHTRQHEVLVCPRVVHSSCTGPMHAWLARMHGLHVPQWALHISIA